MLYRRTIRMFSNVNSWNSDREKEKERGSMTERK